MQAPLIFIHYNDSYYLKYTLESAVVFNSDKQIILLGDINNKKYSELGISHYFFKDFCSGPEIEEFDENYRYTAGREHYRKEWTNFVFRRWFIIYNFLKAHNITSFWTFDSDSLILTNLSAQEYKFRQFSCTEQCSGICMNGFVTNLGVVKGYLDKINELFKNTTFMQEQRIVLEHSLKYAFTEMKAYSIYKQDANISHIRLNSIIDNETFLDSICTLEEHRLYLNDDEYELYNEKLWNNRIKKIYLASNGEILVRHKATRALIKLNTINMSWTPGWLFEILLNHSKLKLNGSDYDGGSKPVVKVLNIRIQKIIQAGKRALQFINKKIAYFL